MITITLKKIRDNASRIIGWETVFSAHEHRGDTEFPLASVIETNGLDNTLWCLCCLPEHGNLWQKYNAWCCREVEYLLNDERSRNALQVAASADAGDVAWDVARDAANAVAEGAARTAAREAVWTTRVSAWTLARRKQREKLRQILIAGEWVEDTAREQLRAGGE